MLKDGSIAPLGAALARIQRFAAAANVTFVGAGGRDAPAVGTSAEVVNFVTSALPLAERSMVVDSLVIAITPRTILVHCAPRAWDTLRPALEEVGETSGSDILEVEAFVPAPSLADDERVDFKVEAFRRMMERAASESASVLAGYGPVALADAGWPLLVAAELHSPLGLPPTAHTDGGVLQSQMSSALRSVDAVATASNGWVGTGVGVITAGWRAFLHRMAKAGDAYDRGDFPSRRTEHSPPHTLLVEAAPSHLLPAAHSPLPASAHRRAQRARAGRGDGERDGRRGRRGRGNRRHARRGGDQRE